MIKTKQEVESFLNRFGIKFDIWGIFYLDRDKNEEALKALGITPMGQPNSQTICISFHVAEHPINYPFKKEI